MTDNAEYLSQLGKRHRRRRSLRLQKLSARDGRIAFPFFSQHLIKRKLAVAAFKTKTTVGMKLRMTVQFLRGIETAQAMTKRIDAATHLAVFFTVVSTAINQPSRIAALKFKVQYSAVPLANKPHQPIAPRHARRHFHGQKLATPTALIAPPLAHILRLHKEIDDRVSPPLHPIPPDGKEEVDNP